jgi:hypothetical protein
MLPLELSDVAPVTDDNTLILPSVFNAPKKANIKASL